MQAGARVLVDGAHAVGSWPGGQELDVPSLAAHYYTANLHKWCMTPKVRSYVCFVPAGVLRMCSPE